MSEMIERVAKAQAGARWDLFDDEHKDAARDLARAAIEAMREPTEEMKEAGSDFVYEAWGDGKTIAREAWQANIDAALGKVDA